MIANTPSNSRKGRQASNGHRLFFQLWLVVGVATIVGVALSWLFLHNNADVEDPVKESMQQKRIKTVLPAPKSSNPVEAKKETKGHSDEDAERARRREMFSKMTTDEKIEYLREQIKNTPIPETPTNRLYATSLEQVMDWIFTCEVGNPPPLLPPMSLFDQMHLAEILIRDNPILDSDSDKAAESKEMMKIAKKEFMDFLKEGGNPDDFLPYYHGQLVAAHEEYKIARQSIVEIIRNDPDIAVDYIKKVNERLSEKGIKNVKIPKKMLDAFGIESDELE